MWIVLVYGVVGWFVVWFFEVIYVCYDFVFFVNLMWLVRYWVLVSRYVGCCVMLFLLGRCSGMG